MAALIGARLGPYEILAALGAGGMGDVYRARDTRLGREVAVKVLPAHLMYSSEALLRFEREARAVAALNHPNILALHDVGSDGGVVYAVTELLEGETLRGIVGAGSMPARRAVDILVQIARGLGAAHDRGIVHRDIKPENLFLTRDGRVKILDFGIATQTDSGVTRESGTANLTQPGTMIGTPIYMAPEQIAAQPATAQSDVFAFGMVAYELLTGVHPFKRNSVSETVGAILRDDPLPLGDAATALPPGAARILGRCLEKQPANRPASSHDLALYLDALATAPDLHAVRSPEPQSDVARIVRRRVFYGSMASALLIIALVWGYTGDVAERAATDLFATERARAERLVHRVQGERFAHVALTADLIASFPELKALFGTDAATVRDFLVNHQALIRGAPALIALLPDGRVLARTDTATVAPPAPGDTWIATLLTANGGPAVVTIDGRLYHAARATSDAGGNTFGHVIAALAVDQEFARAVSDVTQDEVVLLADSVIASTLRGSQAPWTSLREWRDAGGRTDRTLAIEIGSRQFDAQEISLSTLPALAAIVVKARDDAGIPLRRVQNGLVVIGLISVAIALAAAYWIQRSVRRAFVEPHTGSRT